MPFPANRKPSSVLLSAPVKNGECLIQVMSSLVQIGQTHIHRLRFTCYSACSPLQKEKEEKEEKKHKMFRNFFFYCRPRCWTAVFWIIIALYVFRVTVPVVDLSDTCIISVKDDGQSSGEYVRSTNRHMSTTVYMPEQARLETDFTTVIVHIVPAFAEQK